MRVGLLRERPTGGARLNVLQWFGLAGAPLAWALMQVLGWGVSELHCSEGRLGVDARVWQIALPAFAFAVWALATASALAVFRATRVEDKDPEPPFGRAHMLATAALAVNAVFFCMILLAGISTSVVAGCRHA
jgi:hypothetical protein